jgi:hypothetical protein
MANIVGRNQEPRRVRGLSSGLQLTFNVTVDVTLSIKALFSYPVNKGGAWQCEGINGRLAKLSTVDQPGIVALSVEGKPGPLTHLLFSA